ncbi:sugar kinase [Kitasatospora sp. NPDC059327]|uniref:sugar kinase n=1 Tax=Kitasatospora sp. NPDC059327 TaxID=3346803 RepID=UPI0036D1D742
MTAGTPGGLVTFGETMGLLTADGTGPLESARSFSYGIGGAESNVAIGAARLGAPVTWIGRLGADATGDLVERRLRAEGVRVHAIRDDGFTGLMVKHRRTAAVVTVDYHRAGSSASRLSPEDIPAELIHRAGVLHITGITPALSASAADTVRHAVALARAAGVTISLDVNHRPKLWPPERAAPVLRELAAEADVLFAGVAEAELLLGIGPGHSAAELARALAVLGPRQAVLKDGARGCTAVVDGVEHRLPALAVPVVDPVGAGDAFVAGYLTELLAGHGPAQRLATAVTVGAFAVSVPGDCEGLPRRTDLAALTSTEDIQR